MLRQIAVLAFGIALAAGLATQADAAKRTKMPAGAVVVPGCASWSPPFCTILRGPGGKRYSLVGMSVPLNVGVRVVGVQEGVIGPCFAPTLRVVTWSRTRMRCPLP